MTNLPQTIQVKINAIVPGIQGWLKRQSVGGLEQLENKMFMVIGPVAGAYLLSSIMGGFIAQSLVSSIISNRARMNVRTDDSIKPAFERPMMANVRDLQKIIKERNIFNSEGKFPEEKIGNDGNGGSLARFDINAPCVPTTLPIELMGTIYLGDPLRSLATVREKSYEEADIYRVGDSIYGNDQAVIAAVERQKLIINNNGAKECIDLDKSKETAAGDGFPSIGGDFGAPPASAGAGSEITVEAGFVEGELGPGFGKIVDAARLVPNTVDGGINGFKIFSIKGGTLFARIGLQNGDVITQVNDTSMRNAEQGFSLYQAFQDEKEVRIQLLRGGTTPQNITVRIK